MAKHTLILHGRVPSKKNSKRRIQRGARVFMVPSAQHEAWHDVQMNALRVWPHGMIHPEKVTLDYTAPDRRRADLSNKTESVMDLLVDAGILEDDNWFVIGDIHMRLVGVSNEKASVVVQFE